MGEGRKTKHPARDEPMCEMEKNTEESAHMISKQNDVHAIHHRSINNRYTTEILNERKKGSKKKSFFLFIELPLLFLSFTCLYDVRYLIRFVGVSLLIVRKL